MLGLGINSLGNILPTDVAGLLLWLDFSDILTLFTDAAKTDQVDADGDVIGAAEDKSGNGNDATQTVAGSKPLFRTGIFNGSSGALSAARFDGVDDALAMALALENAKTIFVAGKINTVPAAAEFDSIITIKFDASTFSEFLFLNIAGYEEVSFRHDYMGGGNGVGVDVILDTNAHVWSHTYNDGDNTLPASYTARIENIAQTIVASGALSRVGTDVGSVGGRIDSVGAVTGPADMDIEEILAFDRILSVAQQQGIRTYLIDRLGL